MATMPTIANQRLNNLFRTTADCHSFLETATPAAQRPVILAGGSLG
jgi:hypothetical protein